MTAPEPSAPRVLLVESSGPESEVDAGYAARLRADGTFFWLDLSGLSSDRVEEFATALALTTDDLTHLLTSDQRSSFAETHQGVRWVSYGARDDRRVTQLRGVYTKEYLLTVHEYPCRGLAEVRHRYERLRESDQNDGPLVLFMVLDALSTTFESMLARLDSQLDELVAAVLGGPMLPGYVQQVLEVRQLLTPIMRALGPYRRDLVGILGDADRLPGMQGGTQQYLDSHRNHVIALYDAAEDCRDETRDAMQALSSATSERQGEAMNWLTIVAAIFLPLSFVSGYFGMNFSVITHLRGTPIFLALGVGLPIVLAIGTLVMLRMLVHRLGVQLLPKRMPSTASIPSQEIESRASPGLFP